MMMMTTRMTIPHRITNRSLGAAVLLSVSARRRNNAAASAARTAAGRRKTLATTTTTTTAAGSSTSPPTSSSLLLALAHRRHHHPSAWSPAPAPAPAPAHRRGGLVAATGPAAAPGLRRAFGSSASSRRARTTPRGRGDGAGEGASSSSSAAAAARDAGGRKGGAAARARASASASSSSSSSSTSPSSDAASAGGVLTEVLPRILAGFALSFVVVPTYLCDVVMCEGPSMIPTVRPRGEIVFVEKASHRLLGFDGGGGSCKGEERARVGREERARKEREERIRRRAERKKTKKKKMKSKRQRRASSSPSTATPPVGAEGEAGAPRSPRRGRGTTSRSVDAPTPAGSNEVERDDGEGGASKSWPRTLYTKLTTGLSRGDVVVAQHPRRGGTVCKRILGLPGDVVVRHRNDPDYGRGGGGALVVVPDGHVWLEGDNPSDSYDSRSYGAVPAALIEGRVWMRLWPLRGDAVMDRRRRGGPPPGGNGGADDGRGGDSNIVGNSTVLPAGCDGGGGGGGDSAEALLATSDWGRGLVMSG